jgi:hypothetical protein
VKRDKAEKALERKKTDKDEAENEANLPLEDIAAHPSLRYVIFASHRCSKGKCA